MSEEYAYIVVGWGAGGSTVAHRLAQAGAGTGLVIEHGPADETPCTRCRRATSTPFTGTSGPG